MNLDEVRRRRDAGDLDGAVALLTEAIAESQDPAERADLYGMLGGARRQQGDLAAAVAAYDAGARDEQPDASSYNALNRLVARIELAGDIAGELTELQARLERDVETTRAGDPWAAGDLAVAAALNGHGALAVQALGGMAACSPPAGALAKYRDTFASLAALDLPGRAALTAGLDWFEQNADRVD